MKVIGYKNIPTEPPCINTALWILWMDHFQWSLTARTIVYVLLGFQWLIYLTLIFNETPVNIDSLPERN